MTLKAAARAFYALLAALAAKAGQDARAQWSQLDPANLNGSWQSQGLADALLLTVAAAQMQAAQNATPYVADILSRQGVNESPLGVLNPRALTGIASDGRDLDGLLQQPLLATLGAMSDGATAVDAMEMGANAIDTIAATQVSDIGRAAVDVAMTANPGSNGYVRMLVPPSCGRCVVLAGKFYRWSSGFDRHPNDDCVHVPANEDIAGDLTTDPYAYFESLSAADQDRYFGKAAAQAIRDGADMFQVVNARRGAAGLSRPGRLTADEQKILRNGRARGRLERVDVYGRQVYVTNEGTTRRGVAGKRLIASGGETGLRTPEQRRLDRARGNRASQPSRAKTPRLMPESIAEIAGDDRDMRIALLRRFGYLL